MQYRVPCRRGGALLVCCLLLGAAFSLLALTFFDLDLLFHASAALLLMIFSALLARRYLFSTLLYRLSEEYVSPGLDFYRLDSKGSHHLGRIVLEGTEELLSLDRRGRKACRGVKKSGNMTANLLPKGVYALFYTDDEGLRRYVLLEAEPFFVEVLRAEIAHAARLYSNRDGIS